MAEVGLLIAFGVLMGAILHRPARSSAWSALLKIFGPKRLPYAMSSPSRPACSPSSLTCCWSSPRRWRAPVEEDRQIGTARMATAMAIGLECGIVLTVPGVGALALAGLLNVPLGKMLLFGLLLVIPTIIISVAIMTFLFRRGFWNEERDEQEFLGADPRDDEERRDRRRATSIDGGDTPSGGVATKRAPATTRPRHR